MFRVFECPYLVQYKPDKHRTWVVFNSWFPQSWRCESHLVYPLINRLIPRPLTLEIRQCTCPYWTGGFDLTWLAAMSGVENANVRGWRTKFGREFPEVEVKDATVKQTKNRFWFHASGRGGLRFHWYSVGGRKLIDERFGKRFYKNSTPNIQTELTGTLIISIEQIWWDWLGILTRFRLFISVFWQWILWEQIS